MMRANIRRLEGDENIRKNHSAEYYGYTSNESLKEEDSPIIFRNNNSKKEANFSEDGTIEIKDSPKTSLLQIYPNLWRRKNESSSARGSYLLEDIDEEVDKRRSSSDQKRVNQREREISDFSLKTYLRKPTLEDQDDYKQKYEELSHKFKSFEDNTNTRIKELESFVYNNDKFNLSKSKKTNKTITTKDEGRIGFRKVELSSKECKLVHLLREIAEED